MKSLNYTPLLVGGLIAGLAQSAYAQDFSSKDIDPKMASPFAFAESQNKAARAKELASQESGSRVIGGELAEDGEWPWQVALVVAGYPLQADTQFCGGSLVLDNWVLTAAHCIHMADEKGVYRDIPASRFNVVAGTNLLAAGLGDVIGVEAVFRHPDYDGNAFNNDVALIKLKRAPNTKYKTIKVPTGDFGNVLDQPGVTTIVTGWGLTEGGNNPERLHETHIQMLSREMCNSVLLEARAEEAAKGFSYAAQAFGMSDEAAQSAWQAFTSSVPIPITEDMLCSGTFEGGKTACQGDSGGPMVVPLDDGTYIQAGIVSWGLSSGNKKTCAETALFSAYTNTSYYVDWMNETISRNP